MFMIIGFAQTGVEVGLLDNFADKFPTAVMVLLVFVVVTVVYERRIKRMEDNYAKSQAAMEKSNNEQAALRELSFQEQTKQRNELIKEQHAALREEVGEEIKKVGEALAVEGQRFERIIVQQQTTFEKIANDSMQFSRENLVANRENVTTITEANKQNVAEMIQLYRELQTTHQQFMAKVEQNNAQLVEKVVATVVKQLSDTKEK